MKNEYFSQFTEIHRKQLNFRLHSLITITNATIFIVILNTTILLEMISTTMFVETNYLNFSYF